MVHSKVLNYMKTFSGLLAASNLHCCTLTKEDSSEQHLSCINAQSGNSNQHNAAVRAAVQTHTRSHKTQLVTKSQNGLTWCRFHCSGHCSELTSALDIRGLHSTPGKECDVITGRSEVRTNSEGIELLAVLYITEGTVFR
jgi:hypothetical protein